MFFARHETPNKIRIHHPKINRTSVTRTHSARTGSLLCRPLQPRPARQSGIHPPNVCSTPSRHALSGPAPAASSSRRSPQESRSLSRTGSALRRKRPAGRLHGRAAGMRRGRGPGGRSGSDDPESSSRVLRATARRSTLHVFPTAAAESAWDQCTHQQGAPRKHGWSGDIQSLHQRAGHSLLACAAPARKSGASASFFEWPALQWATTSESRAYLANLSEESRRVLRRWQTTRVSAQRTRTSTMYGWKRSRRNTTVCGPVTWSSRERIDRQLTGSHGA